MYATVLVLCNGAAEENVPRRMPMRLKKVVMSRNTGGRNESSKWNKHSVR